MKTLKFSKITKAIDRGLVSKFGEALYGAEEVESISIKVDFKDGSVIGFRRSEDDDRHERRMEKFDHD